MGRRRNGLGKVGLGGLVAVLMMALPQVARADDADAEEHVHASGSAGMGPRVGGHVGLAVPLVSITDEDTTVIFGDFIQLGLAPGITVKLTERLAIDFEFIGFTRWEFENDGTPASASTSFVVDPGVVYDFGGFAGGLRAAVQVGEGVPFNFGLVPIINKGFPINEGMKWFVELDLPVFVTGRPGDAGISFTPLIQTGVAF